MLTGNRLASIVIVMFLVATVNGRALGQPVDHPQQKNSVCFPPNPNINPLFFGEINVKYSVPTTPQGKIYGGLVPFGQVWRLGGDKAPSFVVKHTTLIVNGQEIPAKTYSLFAIPEQGHWTLIISKKSGDEIASYPGPADDLLRTEMKASTLAEPMKDFTISFESTSAGCTMNVDWENTRASATFRAKTTDPPGVILKTKPGGHD